tara:strand:- start:3238 stop:4473 length:1236 start_codon:yes stop_codon:yes gene_type:complete
VNNLDFENFLVALRSIRGQILRSLLTILVIAFGITALVGILTSIDALKIAINKQFSSMGSNSFSIRNRTDFNVHRRGKKTKVAPSIKYSQAMQFLENYEYPADVSISTQAAFNAQVKYLDEKTNPNIPVFASDQYYLSTNGFTLSEGRNFSSTEVESAAKVAIIGYEVENSLFKTVDPIGKSIRISNVKYRVIGTLEKKGSSFGFGGDRNIVIPITTGRQYYNSPNMNYTITVLTSSPEHIEPAIHEATGAFRAVRGDKIGKDDSFSINRSDNLANMLIENLSIVTVVATFIALITLLGAAIGLMNIMLVSVTERTREIGTRMAIGAKQSTIKRQFLIEAIVICQLGGLVGIVLGISIGNVVSMLVGSAFIIPWLWILLGIVICLITGVVAGYYPAQQAAKLNPIDALRYE